MTIYRWWHCCITKFALEVLAVYCHPWPQRRERGDNWITASLITKWSLLNKVAPSLPAAVIVKCGQANSSPPELSSECHIDKFNGLRLYNGRRLGAGN